MLQAVVFPSILMIQTVISYINLCFSALYKKMKLSKVIICQKSKKSKVIIRSKSKKSKVIIFFYPIKSIKKPLLSRLFSLVLLHKPRKHLQTISIRLEHVLGMPLHGTDETLVGHSSSFDETVRERQPSKLNLSFFA